MVNPKTSETSGTNKEEKQDKIITQKTKKEQKNVYYNILVYKVDGTTQFND
jgi:hypothetical protein